MNTWPADKVERRPIGELIPYANNARTHTPAQIQQIAASMREWGFTNPVLIAEDHTIIAGHARVMAAQLLGFDQIPVMTAVGWSEAQIRAYVLADNKLALNAGWDEELLRLELKDLGEMGFDLGLVGFSADELQALRPYEGFTDPDDVPEVPVEPITQQGDLWQLGPHRILCGDCREPADIFRLADGRSFNIGFTSPPYAEQRNYDQASGFRPIPPDAYVEWFAPVAANIARHLADDGSWFVNIKPSAADLDTSLYVFDLVIAHVRHWGWHFATEFCWERNGVPKNVTQRFKNQFEPIYQFARDRWKMRPDAVRHASENVPRNGGAGSGQTTWKDAQGKSGGVVNSFGAVKKRRNGTSGFMSDVQGSNRSPGEYIGSGLAYPGNRLPTFLFSHDATGHTASFPVGLPEFFLKAFSDPGDVVIDPFLGSGSTLIAAEMTGRLGLGCEISPAYVDVAVKRWEDFTGKRAVLVERAKEAA